MKATSVLHHQHRRLAQLATAVEHDEALRIPRLLELVEELMAHVAIEDHFFYWAVADALDIPLASYHDDHARVKNALLQLVLAESDSRSFARRLADLVKAMEAHVALVEQSLVPLVEERMSPEDLEALGERMLSFHAAAVSSNPDRVPSIQPTGTENA
jgi:hypothetical protein